MQWISVKNEIKDKSIVASDVVDILVSVNEGEEVRIVENVDNHTVAFSGNEIKLVFDGGREVILKTTA